ncbi:MAG: RNA polymerase sigma factor, partial [Ktedonobacterales bacterium]
TARESWSEVVRALNLLTEEQRSVVLYRCVLGYPTDDVARLMEKQPGTIRALQFRALASLARHLGLNDSKLSKRGDERRTAQRQAPTQAGLREGRWGNAPRG